MLHYRMGKMITTGVVDRDLLLLIIGQVQHSRWLITANRLCRLWVSKHGLTGENFLILRAIVTYIVCDYYYMWFEIKADSSLIAGPRHKLKEIELINKLKGRDEKSKQMKEIAKYYVEKGAWHAHPEHVLLALLSSPSEDDRRFAVSKIEEIRDGANIGDSSPRPFAPPKLNWKATSIREIQDWSNATEPIITTSTPTNELRNFLMTPLTFPKVPGHTQSCERAVKEVTCASAHVFGAERRDGYIRAKLKSRAALPVIETK